MAGCQLLIVFQCSYVIDMDVHVPWAPDIEVRLPLLIKPNLDEQVSDNLVVWMCVSIVLHIVGAMAASPMGQQV